MNDRQVKEQRMIEKRADQAANVVCRLLANNTILRNQTTEMIGRLNFWRTSEHEYNRNN